MWRVHPEAEQEFIFLENCKILAVGEVIYVVLACVLRATTKKGRQLFREEKCTPDKILATPVYLVLLSPNSNTNFSLPQRVEG